MPETKITELTAEAIRKSGLEVADNIRSYAKKVREEGEAVAKYADEVANAVIEASSHAADRIAGYMQRCEDARDAIQKHEALLTQLPDNGTPLAKSPVMSEALRDLEETLIPAPPERPRPRAPLGRPPQDDLR